jgi:heat shock protein HslJ
MRVVLVAALLAGCAAPGAPRTPEGTVMPDRSDTPAGGVDLEGAWQLTAGTDVPIVEDHPITVSFSGTEFTGVSACNQYGGRVSIDGDSLSIDEIAGTDVGCEPPVLAAERAYLAAFRHVTVASLKGEELVLSGPGIELRFSRLAEPPTAELVDRTWILETLVVGDIASAPLGEPATLKLASDGTFTGSTGCRMFRGTWLERGNQIIAPTLAMDEVSCPDELQQQDDHVVSVIGDGFVPTIEGDLLTLTDPGSIGLVYRAED